MVLHLVSMRLRQCQSGGELAQLIDVLEGQLHMLDELEVEVSETVRPDFLRPFAQRDVGPTDRPTPNPKKRGTP